MDIENMPILIQYKIILLGDSSVGKTSLFMKYLDGVFEENNRSTIGVDLRYKDIVKGKKKIRLNIWDTAGQERFRNLTQNYVINSNGVIFVCDITNQSTFEALKDWLEKIKNIIQEDTAVFILIANKIDLEEKREISFEVLEEFGKKNNMKVFRTSVKTGEGIDEAFDYLTDKLYNNKKIRTDEKSPDEETDKSSVSYRLRKKSHSAKKKKNEKRRCC